MTNFIYPFVVTQDDAGFFLVTFPDVTEAHTGDRDRHAAIMAAEDCLIAALGGYIHQRRTRPASKPR
jgi:antitoxin HicB